MHFLLGWLILGVKSLPLIAYLGHRNWPRQLGYVSYTACAIVPFILLILSVRDVADMFPGGKLFRTVLVSGDHS